MIQKLNVTESEYHALPGFSHSRAKVLIEQTPAHLKLILDGAEPEATKSMNVGTILHALILGKGAQFAVTDGFRTKKGELSTNWQSAEAKEFKADAISKRLIPLLTDEYNEYCRIAEILRTKIIDALHNNYGGMDFAAGVVEEALQWEEDGLQCRARLDWRFEATVIDLKMSYQANPEKLATIAYNNAWDIQQEVYTRAVAAMNEDYAERTAMLFAVCETEPPYCLVLGKLDPHMQQIGRLRWEKAKAIYKQCLELNDWPEYQPILTLIEPPIWMMRKHEISVYDTPTVMGEYNEEEWEDEYQF